MSDDLTRLVPTAGRLHRDDLIFAAGRAAAPSPRWWKRACGLLVVSQAVCLGLWLAAPRPESTPAVGDPPAPVEEPLPPAYTPPDPSSYVALFHKPDRPPVSIPSPAGPANPLLTAGSRRFLD